MLLLFGTGAADGPVGNTGSRHGSSAMPFAACQVRPLDQLKYLAKVMGFEVQVTNIPKVRFSAFQSLSPSSSVIVSLAFVEFTRFYGLTCVSHFFWTF